MAHHKQRTVACSESCYWRWRNLRRSWPAAHLALARRSLALALSAGVSAGAISLAGSQRCGSLSWQLASAGLMAWPGRQRKLAGVWRGWLAQCGWLVAASGGLRISWRLA